MTDTSRAELLKRVPLFSTCSDHELELIGSQMDEITAPKGEELTSQGKPADSFYVVLDGQIETIIDGAPRGVMTAGDFFGEISMLDGGAATATTTAQEKTRLLVISHDRFREFVKANDWLLTRLLGVMALRQRRDYAAWRESDRPANR
jgi:CRP/FNR family transcriptional regulator/CRP/FNR family cyclic AMP-dependent transcriptional regulator